MPFNAYAQFTNINIRAEREGEDVGRGAADLTFEATLPVEGFAQFFADKARAQAWLNPLWREGGDEVTLVGVGYIKLDRDIENALVEIRPEFVEPILLEQCKISKIQAAPQYSRTLDVKLRVQAHPTKAQVGELYELQGRDLDLVISERQHELGLADAEAAGSA